MPSFYIVLQEEIPGVDAIGLEGRALSRNGDRLQELALNAGVPALTSFFSVTEEQVRDVLGEDLERAGIVVPEQKWFDAEDGLRTIRALRAAVASQPLPEGEKLTSELAQFEAVLEAANAKTIRWRLGIDY